MRRRAVLPLTTWVCVAVGMTAVSVLVAVGAIIGVSDSTHRIGLLVGAGVGAAAGIAAAVAIRPLGQAAATLAAEATQRTIPAVPGNAGLAERTTEFADLRRSIVALQRRTSVAEAVADQASRSAETTSAGMFELLSGLVAAEEATRGQLSAELHDSVAQTLMRAKSELSDANPDEAGWERIRDLIEDAEDELRAAMARARPPELRDGDLASAVAGLRRELAARYLLQVHLSWPTEPRPLPLATAVAVYRFFQEALLNVVKHADVDEVDARLELGEQILTATVSDHGPGFEPSAVRSVGGRHVGLGLLRERARLAGGQLSVVSAIANGTTVTLVMPIAPVGAPGRFRSADDSVPDLSSEDSAPTPSAVEGSVPYGGVRD